MGYDIEKIDKVMKEIKDEKYEMMKPKRPRNIIPFLILVVLVVLALGLCRMPTRVDTLADVPAFSGEPYVVLARNVPEFEKSEVISQPYVRFSPLDELGRCGAAIACIGPNSMPEENRGISDQIEPSGWQSVQYDVVDGGDLYKRCELIGYQLTGADENEQNLITGTSYMNREGLLSIENMVAYYVVQTGNHVLYRVTPVYDGDNLVASGVRIEALSVEDSGEGICFHLYLYNSQPDVAIDYATGNSTLISEG